MNRIEIPKLTKKQSQKCEGEITEEELLKAWKQMPKNKSPSNDGITIQSILGWPKNASFFKC